ncbi:hypothetical protein V8C34DRAFT_270203 [Trichoderma compactum]
MTTPAWPPVHSQPLGSLSLNPEASSGRVRQPKGQHTDSRFAGLTTKPTTQAASP